MAKLKKYLSGYKRQPLTAPTQNRTISARRVFGGSDFMLTPADVAYVEWLAKERETTLRDAFDYAISEPRGRVVAQSTDFLDVKPAKIPSCKKWKANYVWYRPTPFRAQTLGERDYREQARRYQAFLDDTNPDFAPAVLRTVEMIDARLAA